VPTTVMSQLRRILAIVALTIVYGLTIVIAGIGGFIVRRRRKRKNRVIINGTFHNPNWFYAHIEPIARSGYGEIFLVSDLALEDLPNLKIICPPRWALAIFTRAGAKAIWTLAAGIRYPADCFMGYHIFPSAVTALICARLTGAAAAYQVTSGPLELAGGGWHAENKLLVALQRNSDLVERLALAVMRRFDLVVVRGCNAKSYILDAGFRHTLEVVTGSVELDENAFREDKDIDVLFVGRLTEYKRPDRFIEVIAKVVERVPGIQVCVVGDGPDRVALEQKVEELGISGNVEFAGQRANVADFQGRAKVQVLTSRWEGVSIAMLEAMGFGAVPVVSDVGDLRDFAIDDATGYVLDEDDVDGFSDRIVELLTNEPLHERLSDASRRLIAENVERSVVASRWRNILADL